MEQQDIFIHFVALQHNSARILPTLTEEILRLIDMVGRERVRITILENGLERHLQHHIYYAGSTDNTKNILRAFEIELHNRNIAGNIILKQFKKPEKEDRVEYLTRLRNDVVTEALQDLVLYLLELSLLTM